MDIVLKRTIFLLFLQQSTFANIEIEFLKDYFCNKNNAITIHVCWKQYQMQQLTTLFATNKIAIFRKTNQQNFLNYLSNDNYFVLDMNYCKNSWEILQKVNDLSLFRYPLKYLLIINNDLFANLTERLEHFAIYPTSELIIAEKLRSKFKLHQPYRIHKDSDIIWEDYGSWSLTDGLEERLKTTSITARRYNLQKIILNVTLFIGNKNTWHHLDDFRYPRIDTFTKQNYNTMQAFFDYINVNATWFANNIWGYYNEETRQWNGLIDDVLQGRAHISASSVFFTNQRLDYVDFIKMQNPLEVRFLLKKPPLSYTINIYYYAFRATVWLSIVVVIVLFGFALFAILNIEATRQKLNHTDKLTISDVTLILLEAVCQQGTTTEPKTISGRIIALILFFAFMFIYVSFSAYIVVLLQSNVEIKNLVELLDSRLECGGYNSTYMKIYITGAKDPIRKALNEKKIGPKGYYSIDDGMRKVRNGFFAFHVELGSGYNYVVEKFTNYEICGLQELEGYLEYFMGYTFIAKNSPYKEIFKVGLFRMDEHGIQKRNNRRYFMKPKCFSTGGTFGSVGMIDCYIILLILFIGVTLSLIILLIERCTINVKTSRRNCRRN